MVAEARRLGWSVASPGFSLSARDPHAPGQAWPRCKRWDGLCDSPRRGWAAPPPVFGSPWNQGLGWGASREVGSALSPNLQSARPGGACQRAGMGSSVSGSSSSLGETCQNGALLDVGLEDGERRHSLGARVSPTAVL